MADYQVNFEREKETKNTVRFQEKPEKGKPPVVGTLYLAKWAAGDAKTVQAVITVQD